MATDATTSASADDIATAVAQAVKAAVSTSASEKAVDRSVTDTVSDADVGATESQRRAVVGDADDSAIVSHRINQNAVTFDRNVDAAQAKIIQAGADAYASYLHKMNERMVQAAGSGMEHVASWTAIDELRQSLAAKTGVQQDALASALATAIATALQGILAQSPDSQ